MFRLTTGKEKTIDFRFPIRDFRDVDALIMGESLNYYEKFLIIIYWKP